MIRNQQIRKLTYTGVFAALIFLTTWLFHVPFGLNGGYLHFGDALIYLAASMLPAPYAIAASAIGAGLSDALSPGGMVWVLPTLVIKSLTCLLFTPKADTILCRRNVAGVFLGGLLCVAGYSAATAVIAGPAVALVQVAGQSIQPIGSGICYMVWGLAMDKLRLKSRIAPRV